MNLNLSSLMLVGAIALAILAALLVLIPDVPKFEEAIYALSAGLGLTSLAHFVTPTA